MSNLDIVGYSQYTEFQSPGYISFDSGQINSDMKILKEITNEIRLYEMRDHTQKIVAIAEENKIKVHMSINIDRDNVNWQIDQATRIANKYPQTVQSIILDKGLRGTDSMPSSSLESIITQIKNKLDSDVPITVAASFAVWMKTPEIYDMVDYALLVSHGYWDGLSAEDAITMSIENGKYLRDELDLNVVVETGYPSDGDIIDCAIPSIENQANFIIGFVDRAEQEKINYVLFSSFSENWKPKQPSQQPDNPKCGGKIIESEQNAENNWGLFSADRKIQQKLSQFALEYFNEIETPQSILTVNSNTQCDIMFKPDISTRNIDQDNSLIINFQGGATKIHDIKVFHEDTGKLIQEVKADYPFKIILSSQSLDVFTKVVIGVNCQVFNITDQEIYDIKETQLVNIQDFEITIAVIPSAYAVCPADEQCIPINITETESVIVEEENDSIILIGIGVIVAISIGIFLFLRSKKEKSKIDYSDLNILYKD